MRNIKTILHPTDLSEQARDALSVAYSLARDHGARLIALHAVPAPAILMAGTAAERPRVEHAEEDWWSYRNEMTQKLRHLGPDARAAVEPMLREGETGEVILRTATEVGADLIVMGTHARSEEEQRVLGSIAEEVVCGASCPVVIVHSPRV